MPVSVSRHPALELCNTFAGWNGTPQTDYLLSYDHLAVWAGSAGLLQGSRVAELRGLAQGKPRAATDALEQAREIRGRLYDLLLDRARPSVFDRFADDVALAASSLRLVRDGSAIRLQIGSEAELLAPVMAAVWSAGELLVSPERARVRACPGTGCGWLFLDRSGRRRWCTMALCGNRAKARRFASRRRPGPGPA
ncbi:MAG TPA: CGNR zinc finger domain-containing protein [Solirubrobacteraceae bacterium]